MVPSWLTTANKKYLESRGGLEQLVSFKTRGSKTCFVSLGWFVAGWLVSAESREDMNGLRSMVSGKETCLVIFLWVLTAFSNLYLRRKWIYKAERYPGKDEEQLTFK